MNLPAEVAAYAAERRAETERRREDFRRRFPCFAKTLDHLVALYGREHFKLRGCVNSSGDEVGKVTDEQRRTQW